MAYESYFKSKFDQSDMIDAVIKASNPKANLETERGGVCQTMTILWIVNSIRSGSPDGGFKELMKHDVGTGVGAAFWTQVCGGQKGIGTAADEGLTKGYDLRDIELQLLAGGDLAKKISSTFKGKGTPVQVETLAGSGGPYFYLAVRNCWGKGGGHGIGFYNKTPSYAIMDPNEGLATQASGSLADLFAAMSTFYGTSDFNLYEVKS
jgi:hypothetical protein